MKLKAILVASSLLFAVNANAQVCGVGKIVNMKEGGWNLDGLHIELEGPNADPSGADKRYIGNRGFIFFDADSLSADRLESIRRIASLAIATGKKVWVNSHNGSCKDATEISLLNH